MLQMVVLEKKCKYTEWPQNDPEYSKIKNTPYIFH